MEFRLDASCLLGRTVITPGGRDKEGRPLLLVTIPADSPPLDIVLSLQYLLSLFSKNSRLKGITAIIDARKGPWKVARSCIRQVYTVCGSEELAQLIVLRPDAFWDKQRVENCTSSQKDNQVIFIPRSRLTKFVDLSQLPTELGGNLVYNHEKWMATRQKVEEFYSDCEVTLKELDELYQYVLRSKTLRPSQVEDVINTSSDMAESTRMLVHNAIETGRELVQNIEYDNRTRKLAADDLELMSTPQDTLDTIERIDEIINAVKRKQQEIETAWVKMEKSFIDTKDLSQLEEGVVKVINWILGPAENLLNTKQKVGYDVSSAEELRREHENIELQCWETYGTYAELIHKINSLSNCDNLSVQHKDLISQKDFMDFVCKSFALRLERRRNILITSLRFFRLVSEYFDRTGEVFDSLVMGSNIADFQSAGMKLKELQESQSSLDAVERELVKEGEKLSDMLSMPVKDSLGREIIVDYSEDIVNIRDILDATTARKNIFSDSVELQKLTLEQVTHIDSYEKDVTQAIQWLDDLLQVMLKDHGHVGCTVNEIQRQKEEHQSFQETAKGTYNYGCQLLNASLVLRQSCKLPLDDHANLYQKLRISWQRLLSVSQEQMTRLRVSAVFHRSVEEQCNQLRDLREAVATIPLMDLTKKKERVNYYFSLREKLIVEVGRMVRLGRLLRSRLKDPLYYGEKLLSSFATSDSEDLEEVCDSIANNEIAVEAISERLTEVTGLAEELDQALHSAQQDCLVFSTASTSTSSLTEPINTTVYKTMENNPTNPEKAVKAEELKSDEEFVTASECTLQHSRSSSYNTASECEHRYSPWWEYGKDDVRENISKEKMVLAVGCPELPLASEVLKPSPEVPPGKIVHEVTETTHIKVQQSHTLGVSSFVLTSETVRDKNNEGATKREEVIKVTGVDGKEVIIPLGVERQVDEEDLLRRMKECGDWISLKILEVTPELTSLGDNLAEALVLQKAHDEVLRQLQNKQSPVEELLRQADQLIATQKPRAEVYAAMAESLGRAWKDINSTLELRKQILDLNVQYHTKAQEFFEKMDALEASCTDTVLPIEIGAVKDFLTTIHELRRALLESLMGALQAGNSLLGKLKELGAEGTLDSRPDRIRTSVNRAISQVQGWLDELHIKRQILEATFNRRKTQLEQCLALALLAADLRDLEDTVHNRRELLANSNQYGDSSSSAELLLHEHKKLLPEAKQLQERALKITKATEQLVASGCFAGEQATAQSYVVLSTTSDYLTDLQNRESLLERVIAFFRLAQTVLTKLDQLEIQLTATELPKTSPQLAQLHAQCSRAIEDATSAPIAEGYAILDVAGRGVPGTDGVRRMVEELENKKITLDGLCTAHREENIRINTALNNFLERHNEIYTWLVTIAEAFLQGHQDMGSDLPLARDFLDLHNQLLSDLQTKGNEINSLLLTLPPILEYLEDSQRKDVDTKVEELHDRWMKLKNILENRLDLSRVFVKFHTEADIVNKEMDKLESLLLQNKDNIDDNVMKALEEKFESIVPLYQSAKNTGITFINEAQRVSEPHLNAKRACLCVESVLERLSGRQLVVTRNWQTFHTEVVEKRELLVRLQQTMAESTKTITWISKLESQLYPVVTTNSTKPGELADHLESKLGNVVPDIKKAQNEVEERIKSAENLISKASTSDEQTLNVKNKLYELNQKLIEISSEYQILLQVLIGYFRNLEEIDKKADDVNADLEKTGYPKDVSAVESIIRDHESSRQTIVERLRFAQSECDQIAERIRKQEPEEAAEQDVNKLQHVLELRRGEFENQWRQRHDSLESHKQICIFDDNLDQVNEAIDDVGHQIKDLKGKYGESVSTAKATSQTFSYFEKTIETLEQRVQTFVNSGEKLLADRHPQSPHIQSQISDLQDRWNSLKKQAQSTRELIDLSIPYFELVEQADSWFKEGSKLLVTIAKKSTSVKHPEEAEELLTEISDFLKPGEEEQNERISKISEFETQLYGPDQSHQAPVVQGNREMIESVYSIQQELQTLAQNLKAAEEERLRLEREQEEARKAEEARKLEEARLAEERRLAEEARLAEERRLAEEARKAEEARLEEERRKAEEARLAEERRKAEEARIAEEKRKAEEARLAEEARIAEEKRLQEEARIAEEKRKAEEARIAEEKRKAEEARIAEEKRKAEEARIAEERRKAEEARIAEERQKAEEARIAAEKQKAEEARIAEEKRKAEELRIAEEGRKAEEARIAEEKRKAEESRIAEEIRLAEEQKKAEELRLAQERKRAEEAKQKLQKEESVEITEITEVHKVEVQKTPKQIPSPIPIVEEASEAPVFISPLSDAVIQEGSKFTFICQVSGYPVPVVTWYKAGLSIQNNPDYHTAFDNGLCSLTIEETFAEDSARYTCRASNLAGEAETTALLSVKETEPEEQLLAPSFTKLLQPATAKENSPFQFECKVEGNPLPTVQWFKNSDCIDNSPDYIITYNNGEAILKFEKVFLEDKAEYTCKASNQCGTAQSTANLIVTPLEPTEAPAFVAPLSNVMARAGQKIKLECEVSGLPLPTLTWSHNGKPVKETRELKLQFEDNKATLIIYEAFPKDAGTYLVSAKNIAGEATSSCSVSVKGRLPTETSDSEMASDLEPVKPSIQLPLTNTTVNEGNRIRLDCVIVGQPEPEVIWYHDDRPVKESQDFQLLFQGDRCSLVIQEALPEDAGEYKVVALNSAGEASSKCILSVTPIAESDAETKKPEEATKPAGSAPKFTKLLTDILVSEGDKVILEGNVVGEPKPEIKWLLNNLPITDVNHFKISHDDEGNVKLEIEQVRPEDKGVYTVKASNSAGEAKCFAQLIVKALKPVETVKHEEVKLAPEFKETFSDRIVFEDTNTKFECIVTGKPAPKVKWLFNGDTISGKDFLISTSGDRQVLSIPTLKKEHSGTITCVAENEIGKSSCAAVLKVQPASSVTLPEFEIKTTEVPIITPTDILKPHKTQHIETSYIINREVVTQTSTSQASKITSSETSEPHIEEHKITSQNAQSFKQVNQEAPQIKESHRTEEYHKVGKEPPVIHEKSSTTYSIGEQRDIQSQIKSSEQLEIVQKPLLRIRPPRFVTPVIGKIIDQNVDVVLEGILDGQPVPQVSWTKNGEELKPSEKISIKWEHNRTSVEIKNANIEDAGRYSCTAVNEGGTAVSTADLVVRKTIFPPVFGRRLQAQVIKKGDRVILEVEVTGTPEPTVTWFKDGIPIAESLKDNYKIKSMGPSHTLVIEKSELNHTGRYMVRAVNSGGEAQSIADIAVYEPTPDTMVEVVKTVVFEDVRKHETLTSAADKVSSTVTTQKSVPVPEPPKIEKPLSTLSSTQMSQSISSKSEISSTTEKKMSHEYQTYKLEHKVPDVPLPKPIDTKEKTIIRHTDFEVCHPSGPSVEQQVTEEKKSEIQETGIETSSISKQSSLQYFVQKIKGEDTVSQKEISVPEPIKPEVYKTFETVSEKTRKETEIPIKVPEKVVPVVPPKPVTAPAPQPVIQEYKSYSSQQISQPVTQEYKSFSQKITKEYSTLPEKQEYKSFSSSQQIIQPQEYKTYSSQQISHELDLKPEPPAEICYAPKPEITTQREVVSEQVKRISETHKELPKHEIPQGGIKLLPPVQTPQAPTWTPPTPKTFEERKEFSQTQQSYQQSSYQTSSSSYSHSYETSTKPVSPKPTHEKIWTPKLEIERPASAASSAYSTSERQFYSRPHSALSGTLEPSQEALQMEKQWAHKFTETHLEKSWPPPQSEEPKIQPSWSVQSTLEKKWTPVEVKTEKYVKETKISDTPRQHYIAEVCNLGSVIDQQNLSDSSYSKSEIFEGSILEQSNIKPSEIKKSWPPAAPPTPVQKYVPTPPKPFIDTLPIRPVSVQDITDEVYLEPGPPPEIGYAEPPRQRRQSYVETIEQELEKNLEPAKVPPCAVRTIPPPKEWTAPPPLPPKQVLPQAPPIPAKPIKRVEPPKKLIEVRSTPFEKFPDLEPFPFRPDPQKPKPPRVGPPPTPSKFIKGRFTDSDYESDFESIRIPPKWKPSMSDTEEPSYRRVRAPKLTHTGRSRSQEHEPLPPSKFDRPPQFDGPPRPEIDFDEFRKSKISAQTKKFTKHTRFQEPRREISPPKIKPASPPVYVQPVKRPDSPKIKQKVVLDGYMADTDEPFRQQKIITSEYSKEERSEYKHISKSVETSSQKLITSKPRVSKFPVRKHHSSSVSSSKKELIATPIITSQTSEHIHEQQEKHVHLEQFPFKAEPTRPKKPKGPPPPSPSRFVKGEFRESDYESDYEGRIPPIWGSDTDPSYKPVRPVLTPTQQHYQQYGRTPTPPTEFDHPPPAEGPPRPKFEPIEKFKPVSKPITKPVVFKPKPVSGAPVMDLIVATPATRPLILQPGSPPEIGYSPGPKTTQYYRSTVSAPYHNAVQTETSNVMHFNESTENCHRTMSLQQTHKVIKFGDQYKKQEQKLEPFPFQAEPERARRATSVPPPPTPSKFLPGEFRESDYESEVESARIRPKWVPRGTEEENLQYRRVRAPASSRSSSVPAPSQRVLTPMEFDTQPPLMPQTQITTRDVVDSQSRRHESMYKKFSESKSGHQLVKRSHSYEPALQPGAPPEYGYIADKKFTKSTATKIASQHMDSMTQAFKSKTQKFVNDVVGDMRHKQSQKPILKTSTDGDAQVYREESRAAQYGTKHVDPDTGLIYFKYDFGYEFGIILPGESKQGEIPVPKKTIIEPPKRTTDIELPVYHEKSQGTNQAPTPQFKPKKFTPSGKPGKWEPTSESEMSEYEGDRNRSNLLPGSRWEPSSCSPVSLSPSLPSTSPAFNSTFAGSGRKGAETPPSCPSTPGSIHGKVILQPGQARAPIFITPLRDIAVVSGQAAKFECIVQSEPPPNILWSKNGRIIENSNDYQLHYRNGVCRLTISQAYPEDAGTYSCTATNPVGTANTNATLQVPGERRSQYIK